MTLFFIPCRQLIALDNGLANTMQDLEEIFNSAIADDEYQNMNGADQDDIVIAKIESFFNSISVDELERAQVKSSKNTTKYRQIFIKNFFGSTKVKLCPRCMVPVRYFKAEYNSRIYLKPLTAAAARKYASYKKVIELANNGTKQQDENEHQQEEGIVRLLCCCCMVNSEYVERD